MMHNENWDDLRFVLAVADEGSVSAAARALGVNHATVLRRVAAFEARHQVAIFERSVQGYSVAPSQAHLIEAMREAQDAILGVARVMAGTGAPLEGIVRVTSTDSFCQLFLPEVLAEIRATAPGLRIELISANDHLDMARLDADIALRPAMEPPEELDGQHVGRVGFGIYARRDAAPTWLALTGNLARSPMGQWVNEQADKGEVAAASDSFLSLAALAQAGLGRAALPRFIGDATPGLKRCADPVRAQAIPLWVLCHRDMARMPRIHAARRLLCEAVLARADTLG